MSVLEVVLVFAGIPLAILGALALLTFLPEIGRRPRYRPGQEWNHAPVWWAADPRTVRPHASASRSAEVNGERGGARGSW